MQHFFYPYNPPNPFSVKKPVKPQRVQCKNPSIFSSISALTSADSTQIILTGMAKMPPLMIQTVLAGILPIRAITRKFAIPGHPRCALPHLNPDGTTGETTQFWLRAKAQAIIDSQSTKSASWQVTGYPGGRGIRFVASRVSH